MTRHKNRPDGALAPAIEALNAAVATLCQPRSHPRHTGHGYWWVDSRYQQLRDGIATASISGHGHHSARAIPCQIDYLKLAIHIDARTKTLNPTPNTDTPARLAELTARRYRPQDTQRLTATAAEIISWSRAIDDLMATKPLYLPDACPRCDHTHAYRWDDEGQRIRTPALAITLERGAWCQQCHDRWGLDQLGILARALGYQPLPGISVA